MANQILHNTTESLYLYGEGSNEVGEHRIIEAIGAGILKVVDGNNHIMEFYCLLTLDSTGMLITLDKFMRNNRSIVKFQPVGTVYGTWYMEFHNADDLETHTVAMEEHNGLWYASNSILKPPTSGGPTKKILSHSAHRELTN